MSDNNPVKKNPFIEVIASVIAILGILLIKPSEKLKQLAYGKNDEHWLGYLSSYIVALVSLITSAYYFQQTGMALVSALFGGLGVSLLNFHYIWPALYLLLIRSTCKLWDYVDTERFWSSKRESWFTSFLLTLGWFSAIAGNFYIAYAVYAVINNHLGSASTLLTSVSGIAVILGVVAGFGTFMIAGLVVGVLYFFTGIHLLAVLLGLVFASSLLPQLQALNASIGLTGALSDGGMFWLATIVFVAYIFPLVHIVMTHGFSWLHRFTRTARQLAYTTPSDNQPKEQAFMVLLATIQTAIFAQVLLQTWAAWQYPAISAVLLTGIGMVLIFNWLAAYLKKDGLGKYGLLVALSTAIAVFLTTSPIAGISHLYGMTDVLLAVLAGLLSYNLVVPYIIGGSMLILYPLLDKAPGKLVLRMHARVSTTLEQVQAVLKRFQESTYDAAPSTAHLFILGIINFVLAAFVASQVMNIQATSHSLLIAKYGVKTVLALLSYTLAGAVLLNNRYYRNATSLLGFVASTVLAFNMGAYCWALSSGWLSLVAIFWGIIVLDFAYRCVFPVLHTAIRAALEYKGMSEATQYMVDQFIRLHAWLWSGFEVLWSRIRVIYDWLAGLLGKFFGRIAVISRFIAAQISVVWQAVRKKMDEIWAAAEAAYKRFTGSK